MAIRVLIVDDSHFFCRRVGTMLNTAKDIKIVGLAHNGQEAIKKAQELQPDVITLDVEMPVMDGITALRKIIKVCDAKVLMLSSMTYENAKITLDALQAGAADFLLKSYESLSSDNSGMVIQLQNKIRDVFQINQSALAYKKLEDSSSDLTNSQDYQSSPSKKVTYTSSKINFNQDNKIIAIGASTGGPVALQKLLTPLPESYPLPIVVIQHMPATFTGAFASRLDGLCQLKVMEAQEGMILEKGHVYIAPGGKQMVFDSSPAYQRIRIKPMDERIKFSPSIDVTLGSASKIYGNDILAIILTGMGNDGTEGCRMVKSYGGQVWIQDESSSVVYGMPLAVNKAGLADSELSIEQFAEALQEGLAVYG